MTTSHTKGPWKISQGRSIEAMFEGEWVQIAALNRTSWSYPDQDKNVRLSASANGDARLIMAAPELLEALQEIVDSADQSNGGKGAELPWSLHVREIAITAIRKAKVVNHLSPNNS